MKQPAGIESPADLLAARPCRIGEIVLTDAVGSGFDLRHRDDGGREDLRAESEAEAAVEIARFDDAGKYRPLKTAPNLRHGWQLLLPTLTEARRAIDFFYPGRMAALMAFRREVLVATPFRETLERQTGMYRVAARISEAKADELVAGFCRSEGGCLRTILWKQDGSGRPASGQLPESKFAPAHDQTGRGEEVVPLLCQEACNLLVAAARTAVKAESE